MCKGCPGIPPRPRHATARLTLTDPQRTPAGLSTQLIRCPTSGPTARSDRQPGTPSADPQHYLPPPRLTGLRQPTPASMGVDSTGTLGGDPQSLRAGPWRLSPPPATRRGHGCRSLAPEVGRRRPGMACYGPSAAQEWRRATGPRKGPEPPGRGIPGGSVVRATGTLGAYPGDLSGAAEGPAPT